MIEALPILLKNTRHDVKSLDIAHFDNLHLLKCVNNRLWFKYAVCIKAEFINLPYRHAKVELAAGL